jgi:alginate O-acetyltransferase complex protein AlgI
MSYTFDVYRGDAPVQPNLLSFGAYVALFPQLIAGPIVRYRTIAEQLDHRRVTVDQFGRGAGLFTIGLAKKVLLANNIGVFWDSVKALPQSEMTVLAAWAGITAFGLQLYFDFSGYSDMAVGLGRMLGFSFERNFFYPYISASITEFWRRWHISLSTWFREYLYIPLGGSRRGNLRTVFNLFLVWAVTGFWHGANWNFVYWGLYYFIFLVCEKYLWGGFMDKAPRPLRHLYTLIAVMVGWALFVFDDTASLGLFLQALGGRAGGGLVNSRILYYLSSRAFVLLAAAIGATPLISTCFSRMNDHWPTLIAGLKPALVLAGLLLSTMYLVDSSYNPFLYFRF